MRLSKSLPGFYCVGNVACGGLHIRTTMRTALVDRPKTLELIVSCPVCGRWFHASKHNPGEYRVAADKPYRMKQYFVIGRRILERVVRDARI